MVERRGANGVERLLICRVASKLCGLPLPDVVETMRPLPVEALPNMPSFVSGLSLIRGRPTPVIDGRILLGSSAGLLETARYVVLELTGRRIALLVDAVLGTRDVGTAELEQLPLVLRDSQASRVGALGALDAELLLVLEQARLLDELRFAPIPEAN
jgi:purine-binding chemotaxis protein CheW